MRVGQLPANPPSSLDDLRIPSQTSAVTSLRRHGRREDGPIWIVGPSGSGKSTILRRFLCDEPKSGNRVVYLRGWDREAWSEAIRDWDRRTIGFPRRRPVTESTGRWDRERIRLAHALGESLLVIVDDARPEQIAEIDHTINPTTSTDRAGRHAIRVVLAVSSEEDQIPFEARGTTLTVVPWRLEDSTILIARRLRSDDRQSTRTWWTSSVHSRIHAWAEGRPGRVVALVDALRDVDTEGFSAADRPEKTSSQQLLSRIDRIAETLQLVRWESDAKFLNNRLLESSPIRRVGCMALGSVGDSEKTI